MVDPRLGSRGQGTRGPVHRRYAGSANGLRRSPCNHGRLRHGSCMHVRSLSALPQRRACRVPNPTALLSEIELRRHLPWSSAVLPTLARAHRQFVRAALIKIMAIAWRAPNLYQILSSIKRTAYKHYRVPHATAHAISAACTPLLGGAISDTSLTRWCPPRFWSSLRWCRGCHRTFRPCRRCWWTTPRRAGE